MDFLSAIIYGILQGLLEWLPISSQGNIIGLLSFLGTDPSQALKLAIFLHAGTMFAAIVYFRKEIIEILKWKSNEKKEIGKFVFIATIATGVTGLPMYLFLDHIASFGVTAILLLLSLMLFITGILQLKKVHKIDGKINKKNAIIAGLAQGFSILPGISRSGITTSTLIFRGFDAEKSFKLSFLMSIPAVFFAQILFGITKGFIIDTNSIIALFVAFFIGLISISILFKIVKKINFAYICFGLGLIYLIAIFLI